MTIQYWSPGARSWAVITAIAPSSPGLFGTPADGAQGVDPEAYRNVPKRSLILPRWMSRGLDSPAPAPTTSPQRALPRRAIKPGFAGKMGACRLSKNLSGPGAMSQSASIGATPVMERSAHRESRSNVHSFADEALFERAGKGEPE